MEKKAAWSTVYRKKTSKLELSKISAVLSKISVVSWKKKKYQPWLLTLVLMQVQTRHCISQKNLDINTGNFCKRGGSCACLRRAGEAGESWACQLLDMLEKPGPNLHDQRLFCPDAVLSFPPVLCVQLFGKYLPRNKPLCSVNRIYPIEIQNLVAVQFYIQGMM